MQIKVICSKVLLPGLSSSKCMPEKLDIFSKHKVAFGLLISHTGAESNSI